MDSTFPGRSRRRRLQNMQARRTPAGETQQRRRAAHRRMTPRSQQFLCILNSIFGGGAKRHRFSKSKALTPMSIARMRSACNFSGRSDEMARLKSATCLSILVIALGLLSSHNASAEDAVTFVTDFGFNGRHAYYYVALDKGYYKAAGMDVKIVRGQGSTDAVKQVASGTAQFGFADTSAVIFAKANDGIPIKGRRYRRVQSHVGRRRQ
jgi:hypothetical protein